MNRADLGNVVLEGSWLYGESVSATVVVVRRHTWFGTGDAGDPDEVAQDQDVETFEVLYGSPTDANDFLAGGGQFRTLDAARSAAQAACGVSLRWEE